MSIPGHHASEKPVKIARPTLKHNVEGWAVEINNLPCSRAASRVSVRDDAVHVSIKLLIFRTKT